jgi:hypothetical protein
MKKTWYFGALLTLFILLGVYQNQISEPNQEIVLKFSDVNITSDEAQSAIAIVKKQLQAIGVHKVRVKELKDGQLKITYYSSSDVESIKRTLSEENNIVIGYSSINKRGNTPNVPSDKKSKKYKLDVFEIHKSKDLESGLDGKYVLSLNQDLDRFYNPNVYIFNNNVDAKDGNKTAETAFKVLRNIAIAIDNTSRNVPEVRAGPTANGNA